MVFAQVVVRRGGDGEVNGLVIKQLHTIHAVHIVDTVYFKHYDSAHLLLTYK